MSNLVRRIISCLVALVFTGTLVLIGLLFLQRDPRFCKNGPIAIPEKCELDRGLFTFKNSGWWYTKQEGKVAHAFCESIAKTPGEVSLLRGKTTAKYFQRECTTLLGTSTFVNCFTNSRISANGFTKYFEVIATDDKCKQGLYFEGSRMALIAGKVTEMKTGRPDPGIKFEIYPFIELK